MASETKVHVWGLLPKVSRDADKARRVKFGTLRAQRRLNSMPQHENVDRARAERLFKAREHQKAGATKATADYYAAQQRIRDRTQELRRLRLARGAQKRAQST